MGNWQWAKDTCVEVNYNHTIAEGNQFALMAVAWMLNQISKRLFFFLIRVIRVIRVSAAGGKAIS